MGDIDFTRLRYLIVDDEAFVLGLSVRILNRLGCKDMVTANNGNEALEQLLSAESSFDVIICDLNMPEMDGVELMRQIASREFTGGVIFLSGEDERMLESAYALGKAQNLNILGVIQKPLKPEALEKMLTAFKPLMSVTLQTPLEPITEQELRDGMNGDELQLVYQPKVAIKTGEIVGVETLARWQHKERGILGPGAFIPLAESTGLINPLTNRIFYKAVQQMVEWQAAGIKLKNSVNFSVNSFLQEGFIDLIISMVETSRINPEHLILEVTETQVMSDMVNCVQTMMRLRLKKFGLSIDDFGTGQSSMTQLKSIPFTELKIDRAFVAGAAGNMSARAILESSVDLARKLRMEIVTEGAETREDWDLVESLGCDYVQGYYCAKPMANTELLAFLQSWTGPH